MAVLDWLLVVLLLFVIMLSGVLCKKYMRTAADWLVADRSCGRYLGAAQGEAAGWGAVSIIAIFQACYTSGPVAWLMIVTVTIVYLTISVTGWGIYRLRETRVMTINQLLEMRYSRKLRIFCGIICFVSGILNMGIFPIVAGRFVTYYSGLPLSLTILGFNIPTVALVTGGLVLVSGLLCFWGGQVSLILTDFLQWTLMMSMYIVVGFVVYRVVNWNHVTEAVLAQPDARAMVDPFLPTAKVSFGLLFFMMGAFHQFYKIATLAPSNARSFSATGAREAKMMWILTYVRYGSNISLLFAAVACIAFLKLPVFADQAANVQATLNGIENTKIQSQMAVPLFLSQILPIGIKGFFLAGMIAASISTLDSYFLSWAGIFVQDVAAPLRGKILEPHKHVRLLRWAVIGVCLFVYVFSICYTETEYIMMYFTISAAIYFAGAGAILLGALYWRRATTIAAWATMISSICFILLAMGLRIFLGKQIWWPHWLDAMVITTIACILGIVVFIITSLLTPNPNFDLEHMLNRKKNQKPKKGLTAKIGMAFKRKNLFSTVVAMITFLLLVLLIGAGLATRVYDISTDMWLVFWKWFFFVVFGYTIPITIWFFIGGLFDLRRLFKKLATSKADALDDGQIHSQADIKNQNDN